jgi:hypothetical protein
MNLEAKKEYLNKIINRADIQKNKKREFLSNNNSICASIVIDENVNNNNNNNIKNNNNNNNNNNNDKSNNNNNNINFSNNNFNNYFNNNNNNNIINNDNNSNKSSNKKIENNLQQQQQQIKNWKIGKKGNCFIAIYCTQSTKMNNSQNSNCEYKKTENGESYFLPKLSCEKYRHSWVIVVDIANNKNETILEFFERKIKFIGIYEENGGDVKNGKYKVKVNNIFFNDENNNSNEFLAYEF